MHYVFGGLIVVDQAMTSRAGSKLLRSNAVTTYQEYLFPLTTLLAPNIHEASLLTRHKINNKEEFSMLLITYQNKDLSLS